MNSLHIIGNLTKDPELRTTSTGLSVCSFTVAVNRKKTKDGQQETDYFNVTAWRERGETCAKYLSKGKKVSVVGPVSVRTWESNEKHGASLEVTAEEVEFLSPRSMKAAFDAATENRLATVGDYFRCAYRSLALSYKQAIDELEINTGIRYEKLYIVGGGAKNSFLNRLTEETTKKQVIALPIEATALGNLKKQMEVC